ncbi:MAG: hypothetical protein IT428_03310 [Planctomycetaceae bacterium]|nr:hypothetical protein [Planctomycetaceae bacterium]
MTREQVGSLFNALQAAMDPAPENLCAVLQNLPAHEYFPPPWTTWTLLSLFEYRKKQDRVRLQAQRDMPDVFPPSPQLVEIEQPLRRSFDESSQWEWFLECGVGFGYLVHSRTQECVTFGLKEDNAGIFFADLAGFQPNEQQRSAAGVRFCELHPSPVTCFRDVGELYDCELLQGHHYISSDVRRDVEPDGYSLADELLPWSSVVSEFVRRCDDNTNGVWLAALIGDWMLAHTIAALLGRHDLASATEARAAQQRADHSLLIRRMHSRRPTPGITLDSGDRLVHSA